MDLVYAAVSEEAVAAADPRVEVPEADHAVVDAVLLANPVEAVRPRKRLRRRNWTPSSRNTSRAKCPTPMAPKVSVVGRLVNTIFRNLRNTVLLILLLCTAMLSDEIREICDDLLMEKE